MLNEQLIDIKMSLSINNTTSIPNTCQLEQLYARHLRSFTRFSQAKTPDLDFVETLLDTGRLEATNPRYYIYGIPGNSRYVISC